MNSAQRDLLAYYSTLAEKDENGHYPLEFAQTVRRLYDALEFAWIYDAQETELEGAL